MDYIITLKKAVKAALKARGVKDPGVVLNEEWGDKLKQALRELAVSKDPPVQTLGQKALHAAISQIGVKESPPNSNSGPQVTEYQKVTGAYHQPWCGSFAKWDYVRAGCASALRSHMSADVTTWLAYPHVSATDVRPGYPVIYQWDTGDVDHIGLFEKWASGHNAFYAVEGNTAIGNDSNGGEVMRRLRKVGNVAAFVRVK